MSQRTLVFTALLTTLFLGTPLAAEMKKAAQPAPRTWAHVVTYVLTNGTTRNLPAQVSRHLGFKISPVATKALRYKQDETPDKMTHAIYVVSAKDKKGKDIPVDIVLGNRLVVKKNGVTYIADFFIRTDLNGRIISALSSNGPVGHVADNKYAADSDEATTGYRAEKKIHLETMDLRKLSK